MIDHQDHIIQGACQLGDYLLGILPETTHNVQLVF